MVAAVAEMHATGTSTRKVQKVAEKMGIAGMPEDHAGTIAASPGSEVAEPPSRDLSGLDLPYLWLDAAYARCSRDGRVACEMLEACCPKAAEVLGEAEPDALAYLDLPASHWKRLRTNDVRERANREIKRRTRVVQVFPSAASLERLAGAVMCDEDEGWSRARCFSERRMAELYVPRAAPEPEAQTPGRAEELRPVAERAIDASLGLADMLEAA